MKKYIIEFSGKQDFAKALIYNLKELVTCKDCKHHEDEEVGMVYCPNIVGGWVREDFYCGNGERKDEVKE